MQQYRFNFPLFIGLVIGTLICSSAVYGLWRFQIGRKSGWLLSEAEKAREVDNFKEAARYYRDYLTIHPKDDEVRIKYAISQADVTQSDDITFDDLSAAVGILESTVQAKGISDRPEAKKLRRRLVELYGKDNIRRYPDALEHLGYLIESDPTDPDLQALRATNLARSGNFDEAVKLSYKLVGYDPKTDEFDPKKATAPGHVELYTNLAVTLRTKQENPELADRVMEQLVETNPKSAEAHLARGRYLLSLDSPDEALSEFEEAYRLAPKDANVLLSMAEISAKDEQYDQASDYLTAGKKLFPQDVRFYSIAAGVQMRQEQFGKAITELDEGIKQVKANDKVQLMLHKLELQLGKRDIKSAQQTLADMQKTTKNIRPEFIDFYNARIMMEERNFNQAAATLNKLRPKMADVGGGRTADVDYYLGLCYESLKQWDMAIKAYESVLQQNSKNAPAATGKERALAQLGLQQDDPWAVAYAEEMKKPKAERNWKKLEEMLAKIGEEQKWDKVRSITSLAQLRTVNEDYDGARKLLLEAQKLAPENVAVRRMLIQLTRLDPKLGPNKALELYQKTVAEIGDSPALRLEKADILISLKDGTQNKEELKSELATLFAGTDQWTNDQKTELWTGMAGRYLNLGLNSEARQYLNLAADAQPHQLPLRLSLFSLALDANDDAGMKDAQDKILKIVGSTNDNNWLYTEARRKLSLVRRQQLDRKELDEIRILVNRALEQRSDWHDLHVLNAELELEAGRLAKALEHFNRAQELGRPYPAATAQHIKLLAMSGQFKQAGELLDRIPDSLRFALLGQLYPEILFRANRVDEALEQARAAIEANPENPQNHYWYGQLLARSSQAPNISEPQRKAGMDNAIKEMRRAVELQPEFPEAWLTLISYYGGQKDDEQAQAVLREAQLALSGDNLQVFLARSYEALRRWFDAETMYRAVYESAPEDLARTQQLAAFYLGNVYPLPDRNVKATPLINKILRAASEKKIQPNDPGLLWARRMGAKMLAESGDYQRLLKAEDLLASNSQDGALTIDDKLAMAEILASRPEPLSRKKAIELLEEVAEVQPLSEKGEVVLGELYFATNQDDWRKYASQMEKAIARFPNSVSARAAYVKNLLNRGDKQSLAKATTHVTKMRQLAPKHVATFEFTVRLLDKLGKQADARAELLKSVPDMSKVKALSEQDVQMLSLLASLLIELDDLDSAEKIYRNMAALDPNRILALAAFLGTHRSVDQGFEKLNEVYTPERIPGLLQVALVVLRKQREKINDKFDAQVQTWLDTGLRENPDSITLLMDQADFYDIQKRYPDAAKVYRDLLKRPDLVDIRRAIVLNNLSFLVALDNSSATKDIDALKLVEEAKDILGPNSDILDTRAVVRISRKEYQQAIEDLELSVTDNPTASKYFHKAQAHLLAGQNRAAIEAWEKAEALGLNHDALNLMEIQLYDELKAKIAQIRGASVTQAEGLRRAG
jgi:tetratricopeptide (TPR) repeat protein